MIGKRLGHYTILSKLGEGGMGEVFLAEDTRLERKIALKLLSAEWAESSDRLNRFRQEAKTLAALDHPNIVTIHSVEEADGRFFITMQRVEGKSLESLIPPRGLDYQRVLALGLPIAEALRAAHHQGIVHRDLKPANVMVTPDGHVKVLDFGLAKLVGIPAEDPDGSPTLTAATAQGAILGTVGYMSPEQAAGRPTDHRSDQFAFGTMLYEMSTGQRPFVGPTTTETLAAILRDQPEPLDNIAPDTPAPLRWIIERCLEKSPGDRYASTHDLALELAAIEKRMPELSQTADASPGPVRRRVSALRGAVLAAIIAALGSALWLSLKRGADSSDPLVYRHQTFRRGTVTEARFDSNGTATIYSAAWDGEPERLYLKRPGSLDPLPLGPAEARLLSISASGEILLLTDLYRVGPFVQAGTLARMSVTGSPRNLAEHVSEALWGPDGELLALVREESGRAVLEYPPGTVRYETPGMIWYPRSSRDGEQLVFADIPHRGSNTGPIVVLPREGSTKKLGQGGWAEGLDWSPDESEIWFPRFRRLMAVDLEGNERVVETFPQRIVLFDIAPDGRVLLAVEPRRWELEAKAASEDSVRNLTWLGWSVPFDISEDGKTILFTECGAGRCTVCLRRFGNETPVVLGPGFGVSLSPDGAWALSISPSQTSELELIATGSDDRRSVSVEGVERIHSVRLSRDGETLFVNGNAPGEGNRIFRLESIGGKARPVTSDDLAFGLFALSPDESRLAVSTVAGGIAIIDIESGEQIRKLEGDEVPIVWSRDGQAIYSATSQVPSKVYRIEIETGERQLMALLEPTDPAGVAQIAPIAMTPDARAYAYGYIRSLTDLYVVKGLE